MSAGPREQTTEPLRDKIAAVLSEHMLFEYDWGVDGDCICGFRTPKSYDFAAYSDHVADAVVEALGLREETKHLEDGSGGLTVHADGTTTSHMKPATRVHRWVSGWTVVGGQQ